MFREEVAKLSRRSHCDGGVNKIWGSQKIGTEGPQKNQSAGRDHRDRGERPRRNLKTRVKENNIEILLNMALMWFSECRGWMRLGLS